MTRVALWIRCPQVLGFWLKKLKMHTETAKHQEVSSKETIQDALQGSNRPLEAEHQGVPGYW